MEKLDIKSKEMMNLYKVIKKKEDNAWALHDMYKDEKLEDAAKLQLQKAITLTSVVKLIEDKSFLKATAQILEVELVQKMG